MREIREGDKIKMFDDTDTSAYMRLLREKGFTSYYWNGYLVVGCRIKPLPDKVAIGKTIIKARKDFGYNRDELAKEIGITRACLVDWEHGRKLPNKEHQKKLEELLDWKMEGV